MGQVGSLSGLGDWTCDSSEDKESSTHLPETVLTALFHLLSPASPARQSAPLT